MLSKTSAAVILCFAFLTVGLNMLELQRPTVASLRASMAVPDEAVVTASAHTIRSIGISTSSTAYVTASQHRPLPSAAR
jgi:hypothetical protein